MTLPTISVIIPVRNGAEYIGSALKSIAIQSVPVLEILIVNDGSTDDTVLIVEEARKHMPEIRLLHGPEKGPAIARNCALREAKGDVIAFLDADDMWPPNKLRDQIQRLMAEPSVDFVSGAIRYFNTQSKHAPEPAENSLTHDIYFVQVGAAIIRRSVFDRIGLFDEEQTYGEDVDLMLRARESDIAMTFLPQPTLYYRRHDASMTTSISEREKSDFHRLLLKSIVRRRRSGQPPLPVNFSIMALVEKKPLTVSVIIPAYNAGDVIGETLDSIAAQSLVPDEIIVVDDGSTDNTAEVVTKHPLNIQLVRQKNSGAAAAINRGAGESSGEILMFLDADDLWTPNKVKLQCKKLANEPELDCLTGEMEAFICPTVSQKRASRLQYAKGRYVAWLAGAIAVRRTAWERVGELDPQLRTGYLIDWIDRARNLGLTFAATSDLAFHRRIRPNTLSQRSAGEIGGLSRDFLTIASRAIRRKRQGASHE